MYNNLCNYYSTENETKNNICYILLQRKKEEEQLGKLDASNASTKSDSGLGLSSTFTALATNLATTALQRNLHAQQGYPSQGSGGDVLGSILGALGISYMKFIY